MAPPEFIPDEKRTGVSPYDANAFRYMDNPSVYLGGNSVSESDVGVSWTVGADGTTGVVDWSKSVAYRPFWRWFVAGNHFANAAWQDTCYYYYPGDTIRMSVFAPRENYLQLRIELLEETTIETYVQKRASYQKPMQQALIVFGMKFTYIAISRELFIKYRWYLSDMQLAMLLVVLLRHIKFLMKV